MSAMVLNEEVEKLRHEFDLSFTQMPREQTETPNNFLGIYLGKDALAIRATDIAGIYADRRIVPMPSSAPTFLGVSRFRGLVTPVYDLAALLGYQNTPTPRWLVLVRLDDTESIAFAFEKFDSFFSANQSNVISTAQEKTRTHLSDAVRIGDFTRPIIHLPSLLAQLRQFRKGVPNHD